MSQGAATSRRPASKLRLVFDAGTIVIEGLAEGDAPGLPGVKFDHRTRRFRAEAIWYRPIVEHLLDQEDPVTSTTPAPTSRRSGHPGREGGVSAPDRGAGGVVEGRRPRAWSSCRPGRARRTWPTSRSRSAERPTLVVTPTIDLMNQWYDELSLSFATEVGLLGGGYYDIRPLTVTTYDSAYLNMERLGNRFGLIVFDECHHLPGPTYGLAAICAHRARSGSA